MLHQVILAAATTVIIVGLVGFVMIRLQYRKENQNRVALKTDLGKVDRILRDAGLPEGFKSGHFLLLRLACTGLLAGLAYLALGGVFAIAGAGAGYFVPMSIVKFLSGRRQKRLDKDLNIVLRHMRSLLESGSSLERAIQQIADDFAPDSYKATFLKMADDMRTGGQQYAFEQAQKTLNNPTFDRFVGYMLVNLELGASLGPLIITAQDTIRDQFLMNSRLNSLSTQTRMTGYFIPVFMGGGLLIVQILSGPNSYWGPLFKFPGNLIEIVAFGMFVGAGMLMKKLTAMPPVLRIFYGKSSTGGVAG